MHGDSSTSQMLIVVLTQLLAFILFFIIMKIFAWKPFLKLLNDRKKKIEDEFEKISVMEKRYNELALQYEEKMKEIDNVAKQKLNDALLEAKKAASIIHENAQKDAKDIIEKGQKNIELELEKAKKELKDFIVNMVIKTSYKFLERKIDEKEDRNLIIKTLDDFVSKKGA